MSKRSKNDFKDDVKYFMNYIVRLSYLVLAMNDKESAIKKKAKSYLHKLNLELYKRRKGFNETIKKYRYMYLGIMLPFRDFP